MTDPNWRSTTRKALRAVSRPLHPFLGSTMGTRTDRPIAALTLDDGPDKYHTPRILDVLAHHEVKSTFFVLARRAALYPDIVSMTLSAGHEIGLHGDDHSPVIGCSTFVKFQRIWNGKKRLEAVLGQPVRFFRPPYGWQDVRAFFIARAAGLEVVGWNAAGGDWMDLTPAQIGERVTDGLTPGSIVLLHDRIEHLPDDHSTPSDLDRAAVVEEVVRQTAAHGIQFVPVGKLLRDALPLRQPWFWRPVARDRSRDR